MIIALFDAIGSAALGCAALAVLVLIVAIVIMARCDRREQEQGGLF